MKPIAPPTTQQMKNVGKYRSDRINCPNHSAKEGPWPKTVGRNRYETSPPQTRPSDRKRKLKGLGMCFSLGGGSNKTGATNQAAPRTRPRVLTNGPRPPPLSGRGGSASLASRAGRPRLVVSRKQNPCSRMVQVVTAAWFASAGVKVACLLLRSDRAVWRRGQTRYATSQCTRYCSPVQFFPLPVAVFRHGAVSRQPSASRSSLYFARLVAGADLTHPICGSCSTITCFAGKAPQRGDARDKRCLLHGLFAAAWHGSGRLWT